MDKNKIILIGVVAALVLGGVFYLNISGSKAPTVPTTINEVSTPPGVETNAPVESDRISPPDGMMEKGEKMMGKMMEVMLEAKSFSFSQKEIRVKKGDTVKIQLTNKDGFHDWTIDEFNAKTKQIPADQTDTVEFVADKTGTFEYYCSVGQHRANGMVGKLIVE